MSLKHIMCKVMMYTRAPASDYDDWAKVHDNPGWSFSDLLPLIKKVRGLRGAVGACSCDAIHAQAEAYGITPDQPTHGYTGPLKVSYGSARTKIGEDYLATIVQYDKTREVVDDANGMIMDANRLQVRAGLPFMNHRLRRFGMRHRSLILRF